MFTHTFRGDATILDADNKVLPYVTSARERGVLFDTGCSRINYTHACIKAALADGFAPQIISSDLVRWNFYKTPVFTLLFRMSLFLNMGMSLYDIVKAVTYTPAKTYQILDEAGTLQSVSYTHLDVYKRQGLNMLTILSRSKTGSSSSCFVLENTQRI